MRAPIDAPTFMRLLRHEAHVHSTPGRELRDLGDSLLLHDPVDPEPFWNRLEGLRWPSEPAAFDRRLAEVAVLFAALGRQPHVWVGPPHDEPADLAARLAANGFEDMGKGLLMVTRGGDRASAALAGPPDPDITLERLTDLKGAVADAAADSIVGVLLDSFGAGADRRAGVTAETVASLSDARFTHYLARHRGEPAAVARRATFDGLSYLSSIGTMGWARGRGLGRLVTASALLDAVNDGSDWIHLGVFEDNAPAIELYKRLGFWNGCEPGPDMLLVG
jgi:ribosomal protein S18 acetylase RimI-like enzyme